MKSYNQQRRDARQMIIKAARELQMKVVPEGGSLLYMNETMVLDGHTGVEHSLPVPRLYKDVVTLFAKSKAGYTPTLIVGYGGLSGEYYWYQHTNVWENERLLHVHAARGRRRALAPPDDGGGRRLQPRPDREGREADRRRRRLGAARRARPAPGARRALGAVDAAAGRHDEPWRRSAPRRSTARGRSGSTSELGSIEKGKLADLIVLDRNPLENIRNTESIAMVMVNGRLYDAKTLNEIGNHPQERPKLCWER